MNKLIFSIQYAGLTLPVMKDESGVDVTPLKPISDLLGVMWHGQRKKILNSPFFMRHLGICINKLSDPVALKCLGSPELDQETGVLDTVKCVQNPVSGGELLIRIDRVAAFLMSVNPDRVRAAGNVSGAEVLEAKLTEWADALHDYEEIGVALNLNHMKAQEWRRKQRASFAQMIGVKNKTPDGADRIAIGAVIKQMAAELGVAYQPDLPV